jgi:hypothetical protein
MAPYMSPPSIDESTHHNGSANGAGNGTSNSNHIQAGEGQQNGGAVSPLSEPIAIVGMSVRLPGDVTSTEEFWELCSRGRSGVCITLFPFFEFWQLSIQ